MKVSKEKLETLQGELVEKEKIALAVYAGLAAFSSACLLRLITIPSESWVIIASTCFFLISTTSFVSMVLSKYHVLHIAKGLHIGHVIVWEDSTKHTQTIGWFSFVLGFLLMLFNYSVITFLIGVASLALASKHHMKFKKELDTMTDVREVVEKSE